MNPAEQSKERTSTRFPDIEEVRLISDLRVMHAKVDELYLIVTNLKRRHDEATIHRYADQKVLVENISRVDKIYLWFISLEDQVQRRSAG